MKKPTSEYSLDHPSSGLSRRGFLGVAAGTAATAMTPAALLAQANDGSQEYAAVFVENPSGIQDGLILILQLLKAGR